MFSASWNAPVFTTDSPMKQTHDLVAAAILDREADAGRERHVAADDAVAAEEVRGCVSNMCIEPPLPRAHAVDAAEQLGHHGARRHAARERLAVVAVRRDDVVVGAEQRERAGAHRFLSDVQVAEAADLAERVRLGAALLEAALQQHRAQQLAVQLADRTASPLVGFVFAMRSGRQASAARGRDGRVISVGVSRCLGS